MHQQPKTGGEEPSPFVGTPAAPSYEPLQIRGASECFDLEPLWRSVNSIPRREFHRVFWSSCHDNFLTSRQWRPRFFPTTLSRSKNGPIRRMTVGSWGSCNVDTRPAWGEGGISFLSLRSLQLHLREPEASDNFSQTVISVRRSFPLITYIVGTAAEHRSIDRQTLRPCYEMHESWSSR